MSYYDEDKLRDERGQDVRCLCPRCLQDYFSTNKYFIRRLDPYAVEKDACLRCGRPGYDYILSDRQRRRSNVRKRFLHI